MVTIKTKIWVSAGVFLLSGAQAELSHDSGSVQGIRFSSASAATPHDSHKTAKAGEGGEGGEGGESGEKKLNAAERKIDFLKNLSLVEGHLIAGVELYRAGAHDAAKSHMKHPGDELYRVLAGGMKEFRSAGFAGSLKRMAVAVEQKQPVADVDKAFKAVSADIDAARATAHPNLKIRMLVVSKVMHEAAKEYAEGVKDGKVVNAHEYQDAYGFFTASKQLLAAMKPVGAAQKSALEQTRQSLKDLDGTWPSLTSDTPGKPDAASLHGASSRIELVASSL